MTQTTQEKLNGYDPSKLEAYLKINPDVENSILYSLCGATTDSEKGYIRKKKSRLLEGFERVESSNNKTDSKRYKGYTKKKVKDIFHDIPDDNDIKKSYSYFYDLLLSYPTIPLFIFSKIYNEAREKYGNKKDESDNWSFSFYNVYMNVVSRICNAGLDDDILEYFLNVDQYYGNTCCQQFFNKDFIKEELEKLDFLPEDQYQVKLDRYEASFTQIEKEEESYPKRLERQKNYLKHWITEGIYDADYYEEKERILGHIKDTIDTINEWVVDVDDCSFQDFKGLRAKILFFIFFELDECNAFLFRKPDITKEDTKRIVLDYNRYNQDKKSFVECIKQSNHFYVSYNESEMTVKIDKDRYIDLGTHGEEYLGTETWHDIKTGIEREVYFDTVEFI